MSEPTSGGGDDQIGSEAAEDESDTGLAGLAGLLPGVGAGGPGSLPDFGALLSRLGEVQESIQAAQESAAARVIEGSAGGGAVRIRATGDLSFQEVLIDPSVVDAEDIEMLQDLVLAALRDVMDQIQDSAANVLGGIDLGGGLGGLLGS
jgi:hypothetical protein